MLSSSIEERELASSASETGGVVSLLSFRRRVRDEFVACLRRVARDCGAALAAAPLTEDTQSCVEAIDNAVTRGQRRNGRGNSLFMEEGKGQEIRECEAGLRSILRGCMRVA